MAKNGLKVSGNNFTNKSRERTVLETNGGSTSFFNDVDFFRTGTLVCFTISYENGCRDGKVTFRLLNRYGRISNSS